MTYLSLENHKYKEMEPHFEKLKLKPPPINSKLRTMEKLSLVEWKKEDGRLKVKWRKRDEKRRG